MKVGFNNLEKSLSDSDPYSRHFHIFIEGFTKIKHTLMYPFAVNIGDATFYD